MDVVRYFYLFVSLVWECLVHFGGGGECLLVWYWLGFFLYLCVYAYIGAKIGT